MNTEIDRRQRYLDALERAGCAIDQARRLYPDFGLDHAIDRLRALMLRGAAHLDALLDDANTNCECEARVVAGLPCEAVR